MQAKEYAKAIYDIVQADKIFIENFDNLIFGLRENLDYYKLMESKKITKEKKKELVTKLVQGDLQNLLYVLIDNNRFNLIEEIYKEFNYLIDESNNVMRLLITTCKKVSKNDLEEIIKYFEKTYSKKIEVDLLLDEGLISGIKVSFAGKLLDVSVTNELSKLKHKLTKEAF